MKGKDLKELVAKIPDEATVLVSGVDCGGYDAIWKADASVSILSNQEDPDSTNIAEDGSQIWYVEGAGKDVFDTGKEF